MDERTVIAALAAIQRAVAEVQWLVAELAHEIVRVDRCTGVCYPVAGHGGDGSHGINSGESPSTTPAPRPPHGTQSEGRSGERPGNALDERAARDRARHIAAQSREFVAREAGEPTGGNPSPACVDEINSREPLPVMATSAVWIDGKRTELAGPDSPRKVLSLGVSSQNLPAASDGVAGLSGGVKPDPGMPAFLRRADGSYIARLLAMPATMPEGAHA